MACPYFPHTASDVEQMLQKVGVKSLDDLYSDVPEEHIYTKEYDLEPAYSEDEVRRYFKRLAADNAPLICFAGGGVYDHYQPAVVPYILSRSEFLTAYTPYQAEISQGTLRYIFEFQTMITRLTGLETANASLYDGATAAAESMLMSFGATRKKTRFLLSETLFPQVRQTVETYAHFHGVDLTIVPQTTDGTLDAQALKAELSVGDVAGVLVPTTNKYGLIEDLEGLADACHEVKALLCVYSDLSNLAVLKTPGEWGADVAVGDCQSLGFPMSYGGPYCGYMATKMDYVRKMPGRIVGETVDRDGKRCYCLTLQAREQHIRREKATSNICSNQSLMALYATIYLSLMGPQGLREVATNSYQNAHYLHDELLKTGMFSEAFKGGVFFNEFTLKVRPNTSLAESGDLQAALLANGILGAIPVGDGLVSFACTERTTAEQVNYLLEVLNLM